MLAGRSDLADKQQWTCHLSRGTPGNRHLSELAEEKTASFLTEADKRRENGALKNQEVVTFSRFDSYFWNESLKHT